MKIETYFSALHRAYGEICFGEKPVSGAIAMDYIRSGIIRRYERLQAENARLRAELDALTQLINLRPPFCYPHDIAKEYVAGRDSMQKELEGLAAENAGLRAELDAYKNQPAEVYVADDDGDTPTSPGNPEQRTCRWRKLAMDWYYPACATEKLTKGAPGFCPYCGGKVVVDD